MAATRRRESPRVPPALAQALHRVPDAMAFWTTLAPSHRKQWLYWMHGAKRPETRERRIAALVKECAARRKPGMTTPSCHEK